MNSKLDEFAEALGKVKACAFALADDGSLGKVKVYADDADIKYNIDIQGLLDNSYLVANEIGKEFVMEFDKYFMKYAG